MSTNISDLPPPSVEQPAVAASTAITSSEYNPNLDVSITGGGGRGGSQMDGETLSEFVRDFQQASAGGGLALPARDIPQIADQQQDEQGRVNYVPPAPTSRRVRFEEEDDYEQIEAKRARKSRRADTFQQLYDDFQTPILIAVLFFIFQLPVVRLRLYQYLPVLFNTAGAHLNLLGICMLSVLFGLSYLFLGKFMDYVSSF